MTRTLFSGGEVFDGTGAAVERADVAVEDGRIVEVGTGLDGDVHVDCVGKTVLPGLVDCHVHVATTAMVSLQQRLQTPFSYRFYEAARNLRLTLDRGITTIRDASGADRGIQQALEDGLVTGPRLVTSIGMMSPTGGHADSMHSCGIEIPVKWPEYPGSPRTIADGPAEVRRVVRSLVRAGADWIKVATTGGFSTALDGPEHEHYDEEELAVLVRTAAALGRPVMAHAHGLAGIKNAIRAGVRSIEHGVFLDDEAIDMMAERGTWLVPTLTVPVWSLEVGRGQAKLDIDDTIAAHAKAFRRAVEAGVQIAMGTDCGIVAHGENLRELALMTDRGMTTSQALATATSGGARLLGLADEIGTVEPGKRADLVVVNGRTARLDDLRDRIEAVYLNGKPTITRSGTGSI